MKTESTKLCPCGCGVRLEVSVAKPSTDLSLESFDIPLQVIKMSVDDLIELEEKGRVKDLAEYVG